MRQDYAFLSGHKAKNKWKEKSPTLGKTVKGWENGGGDCVISKEAKLLFSFLMLLWDKIEFQCGCRLTNGPLSEEAGYKEWSKGWGGGTLTWERLEGSLSHRFCWGLQNWHSFGCLDFDGGLVALVNVAVYALSRVGESMSDSLCPSPVPQSDPKEFTFRAWSHHYFFFS